MFLPFSKCMPDIITGHLLPHEQGHTKVDHSVLRGLINLQINHLLAMSILFINLPELKFPINLNYKSSYLDLMLRG